MKLGKLLNEIFDRYIKDMWGNNIELYINPKKKELEEIIEGQRTFGDYVKIVVIADKKLMYAAKGDCLHETMILAEKIDLSQPSVSRGYLQKQDNKWVLTELEDLEKRKQDGLKYDWTWIKNPILIGEDYIDISYLNNLMEKK